MDFLEVVFVTVKSGLLDSLSLEDLDVDDITLSSGTTDRQEYGFLLLLNGQKARKFLDDFLELGMLLDYTVLSLPVPLLCTLWFNRL